MMSKKSLRKQADFVADKFKQLNDDFLVMYGYLLYEYLDSGSFDADDELRLFENKIIARSESVKIDVSKIYKQQYQDNGYRGGYETITYPAVISNLKDNVGVTFLIHGKKVFFPLKKAVKEIKKIRKNDTSKAERLAKQVADSGLRVQHNDATYRIDNFIRFSTLQGIKDINTQVQDILFEEMKADGWEIDYHDNPRPSHAYMGGRQFVVGRPRTINGIYFESFEEVAEPRLAEPNCLHFKIPIICGVTKPLNETAQLEQWKKADQAKIKYAGKDFTKYEATQVQRRLEEEIRKCDDRIKIAQSAKLDVMRRLELSKRRTLFNEYKRFSKALNLDMRIKGR